MQKTNERPGTRAVLRSCRMSSYKAREVLDLVRGAELGHALELLDHVERAAAPVIAKLVRSAAANAEHNDGLDPEELFVAACFADEGTTLKRWRPRARGRATRIRKRSCHITVILARMPDERIARKRARAAAEASERRARRVAGARRRGQQPRDAAAARSDGGPSPVVGAGLSAGGQWISPGAAGDEAPERQADPDQAFSDEGALLEGEGERGSEPDGDGAEPAEVSEVSGSTDEEAARRTGLSTGQASDPEEAS